MLNLNFPASTRMRDVISSDRLFLVKPDDTFKTRPQVEH